MSLLLHALARECAAKDESHFICPKSVLARDSDLVHTKTFVYVEQGGLRDCEDVSLPLMR
jgi:hypothetical protein